MKKLSEMSLEELWQLFPIRLTEHDCRWQNWFTEEKTLLLQLLSTQPTIHHIGSTAIKGIWAKPIIDILIETNDMTSTARILAENGYLIMSQSPTRISLNKGYTEAGFAERVFHIHLRTYGDCDEIYFRDYLNAHADIAKQYEALKLDLWKRYEHDRDGYTDAKTDFIKRYTLKND